MFKQGHPWAGDSYGQARQGHPWAGDSYGEDILAPGHPWAGDAYGQFLRRFLPELTKPYLCRA